MTTSPEVVAARFPAGTTMRWLDIELAVFEGHPKISRILDQKGRRVKKTLSEKVRFAAKVLMFSAPVFAFATVAQGRFVEVDGTVAIPVASVIMAFGLLAPLWFIRLFFQKSKGESRHQMGFWAAGVMYIGVAGLMTWMFFIATEPGQDILLWLIPIAAMAALGAATIVLDLIQTMKTRDLPVRVPLTGPRVPVRRAVAALSADDRAAIRARLEAILVHLERQGSIDRGQAAHARQADLGMLSIHMSQPAH